MILPAIIKTNDDLLLIECSGIIFSKIEIKKLTNSLMKILLKMSSVKCHLFCLSLNELSMAIPQPNNGLRAKFVRENKNIYSQCMSFLHIEMTQVVETLPQVRQKLTYSTYYVRPN